MASTLSEELKKIIISILMYWWESIRYSISKTVSYLKIELFDTELKVLGKIIICIFEGKY